MESSLQGSSSLSTFQAPSSSMFPPPSSSSSSSSRSTILEEEECSEIHTIQMFRDANDVTMSNMNIGGGTNNNAIRTIHQLPFNGSLPLSSSQPLPAVPSQQHTDFSTTTVMPFAAPIIIDGVGDDQAVLDMAVTEDEGDEIVETLDLPTTLAPRPSSFYSFFFEPHVEDALLLQQQQHAKENIVGEDGDDFTITSHDTKSSLCDPEDLSLDLDISMQDSTLFWEQGLTTSESSPSNKNQKQQHHQSRPRRVTSVWSA